MKAMKHYLSIFLFFLLLCSCSKKEPIKIAYDPNWFGARVDPSEENLNGLVEEFLLIFTKDKGKKIYKMEVNWDSLQSGLLEGRYEGILTSTYPYNFEKGKFDFSTLFFPTGNVLIYKSKKTSHYGINLGVRNGDSSEAAIEKMPSAHLIFYEDYAKLLQALEKEDIDFAVMPYVIAVNYLSSAFYGKFHMEMPPLEKQGIRLAVKKGTNSYLLHAFDSFLKKMKKRSSYQKLLEKWNLAVKE